MNNNYIGLELDFFRQPKIQRLEIQLGYQALITYQKICLKLAEMEEPIKMVDIPLLEREFFCKQDLINQIINFPDLFIISKDCFSSSWVDSKLAIANEKKEKLSEAGKLGAKNRWNKEKDGQANGDANGDAIARPMATKLNKTKLNETKLNKTKVKEIKINKNKEEIDNFFSSEDLKEITQRKFSPLETQVWFDNQAVNTFEIIKEQMLNYYEANQKKEIKNMKMTFLNWLNSYKRTDFYKYLDKKDVKVESPVEMEYSKRISEELPYETYEREEAERKAKFDLLPQAEREKVEKEKEEYKQKVLAMLAETRKNLKANYD